jgi:pSer/pThr/pTyr-binding forkhead associated (FHA) protein
MTRPVEPGTRIGRGGPDCDIALTGDDLTSAKHARLLYIGRKCLLEDLDSTNGTFVSFKERIPVRRGLPDRPDSLEEILIGQYLIKFVEHQPESSDKEGSSVIGALYTRVRY